jgi:hypothetical protein
VVTNISEEHFTSIFRIEDGDTFLQQLVTMFSTTWCQPIPQPTFSVPQKPQIAITIDLSNYDDEDTETRISSKEM